MPPTSRNGYQRVQFPTEAEGGMLASPEAPETIGAVAGRNGSGQEGKRRFVWKVEQGASRNYRRFGERLAESPDLFRNKSDGLGLVQVLPSGKTRLLTKAAELAPVIADRVRMVVTKEGKVVSELPRAEHLNAMLRSEKFLSRFRPVDQVVRTPFYSDDFTLVRPGYHDGGPGGRTVYAGPVPATSDSLDTINAFLDVMEFAGNADRTNTVGAALTVLLRHRWHGEKPVVLVTATRSHAGKGTITEFVRGAATKTDVLYEGIDWPMQSQFQRQIKANPDIGVVVFDNVRLDSAGGHGKYVRSAFIESFVTSAELTLASPGGGEAITLDNTFVVSINTNDGALSPDLMNRALTISLAPKGNVQERLSPIGNPKLEFLPANRDRIDAELRGMIERWKRAGRPLDEGARHPMTPWARTVGGILKASGFTDFLGNFQTRKTACDPVQAALAVLGSAHAGKAMRPKEWAKAAVELGLAKILFSSSERETEKGRERLIGVVLSKHANVTLDAHTDTKRLRLRLEGGLRRWVTGKNPHARYVFVVLEEMPLPVEDNVTASQRGRG